MDDIRALLVNTAELAADFLAGLDGRPVGSTATVDELRASLDIELGDEPVAADAVFDHLVRAADPGVVAMASGRYFGFVIGSALPAAIAADWMTSAWDQNAGMYALAPAAAVVEETVGRWLKDLLQLPSGASFALVTGCQMAHFTALSAARLRVLEQANWDVNEAGLDGAPAIRVLVGNDRHVTVDRALRYLGIGSRAIVPVATDADGRIVIGALERALSDGDGPTMSAPRPARSTRERSIRYETSATWATALVRGFTSTVRSACGRRHRRRCGHSSPASNTPTPGPPTPTSG